jgi:heme oxygenase
LHFAHIFLTFESVWADLVATPRFPTTKYDAQLSFLLVNPYDTSDPHNMFSATPTPQMLTFLRDLRPVGLARSARLRADLETLTGLNATDLSVLLATYPGDKVEEYCAHIRLAVAKRPHALVAYAWCYYMAVFSGGRWIRGELTKAPDPFWRSAAQAIGKGTEAGEPPLSERGLSLWNFDGEQDGEDIKAQFKARLADADVLFTDEERVDVIEEAKQIFVRSAQLVEELDRVLGTDIEVLKRPQQQLHDTTTVEEKEEGLVMSTKEAVMWLKRPEVTGAAVALGCLVCVALLKFAT